MRPTPDRDDWNKVAVLLVLVVASACCSFVYLFPDDALDRMVRELEKRWEDRIKWLS